jgi:hypothetical protein
MSTLQEVEYAVKNLSGNELNSFRDWFQEYDAEIWDKEFERDVLSGKLEKLAENALKEYHSNKCKEI